MKICGGCKSAKSIDDFHRSKLTPDGRSSQCKECVSRRGKQWRKDHPDRKRDIDRAYNLSDPARHRARSKQWRIDNPAKYTENMARYYIANRESIIQASHDWRASNPVRAKVQRSKDKAKRRVAESISNGYFTAAEWVALVEQFEGRCVCCGKRNKLTADHIIPISKGGNSLITNIQPLCGSCNSSKGARHATDYRLSFRKAA